MTRKIFRSILLVAGVVLAAGMVIMTGCLYSYFGGVQEQQLQDELSPPSAAWKTAVRPIWSAFRRSGSA
ncbi:MAG: hypothetical protein ACLUIX_01785 [Oscillospiraceae bacterium]